MCFGVFRVVFPIKVAVMDAMKMEFSLKAPVSGIVTVVLVKPGDMHSATQPLMYIE